MRTSNLIIMALVLAFSAGALSARDVHPDDQPPQGRNLGELDPAQMLDRLFGRLHREKDPKNAKIIARAIWQAWSHPESTTAAVLLLQAQRAMQAKQYRISIAILSAIIEEFPEFAEAWNKRATVYYAIGEYDRSLKDIEKVLDLEPRHFGALSGRGMIYHQLGKNAKALKAFRRALAINPHLVEAARMVKQLSTKTEKDI